MNNITLINLIDNTYDKNYVSILGLILFFDLKIKFILKWISLTYLTFSKPIISSLTINWQAVFFVQDIDTDIPRFFSHSCLFEPTVSKI